MYPDDVLGYRKAFASDPRRRLAMNAVTKTSVRNIAMDRQSVVRSNHIFSHLVKAGAATSQNGSGRCWMFAGLNTFRIKAAEKMNLEDFELSQNFPMFWDKLEKSNFFLESILGTLDEETDGRLISWLVRDPIQDGGQWDMFVNIVKKYGVVPKEAMPETESSGSTGMMNDRVTVKLRAYAARLRKLHRQGASLEALKAEKAGMLEEVYRMLAIHLGEPPTSFLWQWRDKDKVFHRDGIITPQEFLAKYVPVDLDAMVCLIHCPQASVDFNKLYTIDYLGNVVGGQIVRYLNVDIEVMKKAAVAMIRDERPVWFGCDVGKMFDRDLGLMDVDLFDYEGVYETSFETDKAERLDYGHSQMNHAMVFTGVDLDDEGQPRKWRVENSWGDKGGDKGFMIMTDAWFDAYNYEVVVDKKHLSPGLLAVLDTAPIGLPPWHPMGALARAR
ncbi:MAG: C1 family peptidase [Armatimonadetes bacterium]|nr:C1 family peptidase [Armatimonadota bacterium]